MDIGKILTADDRGKEISGMAGGVMGSLAGQRLLMPIIVGYGSQWGIPRPLLPVGGSAIALGLGAYSCFYYGNIYDNKETIFII